MGRNPPLLPRSRRGRVKAAAPSRGEPDQVATVYAWLCRFSADPEQCEDLVSDVLRRSRGAAPACLRSASEATRLQFLSVQAVLRLRGVL